MKDRSGFAFIATVAGWAIAAGGLLIAVTGFSIEDASSVAKVQTVALGMCATALGLICAIAALHLAERSTPPS